MALTRKLPIGTALADAISRAVGSWPFVIAQTAGLAGWITINTLRAFHGIAWDEPPYILLNLMLSFQAAYTGPILLIAARRQDEIQRRQLRYMLTLMEVIQDHLTRDETGIPADARGRV